jgi:hypothetical protein
MKRALAAAAAVIAAIVGLTACSGGNPNAGPTTAGPPPPSSSAPHTAKPTSLATEPSLADAQGALNDVSGLKCTSNKAGNWSATGTVKNSQSSPQDYAVQISVIVSKTATVQGDAQQTYHLAPGKSAQINFPNFYTNKSKGLQCVPHVIRAAATK